MIELYGKLEMVNCVSEEVILSFDSVCTSPGRGFVRDLSPLFLLKNTQVKYIFTLFLVYEWW